MTCKKCGKQIDDRSTVCPFCNEYTDNYHESFSKRNVLNDVLSDTDDNKKIKIAEKMGILSLVFLILLPALSPILGLIGIIMGNEIKKEIGLD